MATVVSEPPKLGRKKKAAATADKVQHDSSHAAERLPHEAAAPNEPEPAAPHESKPKKSVKKSKSKSPSPGKKENDTSPKPKKATRSVSPKPAEPKAAAPKADAAAKKRSVTPTAKKSSPAAAPPGSSHAKAPASAGSEGRKVSSSPGKKPKAAGKKSKSTSPSRKPEPSDPPVAKVADIADPPSGQIKLFAEYARKTADASGIFNVGWMYYFGIGGTAKDIPKAVAYFTEAASLGHDLAHYHLGLMRRKGEAGFPKVQSRTIANFDQAVKAGKFSLSAYQLGRELIASGKAAEGRAEIQKSADQGCSLAVEFLKRSTADKQ